MKLFLKWILWIFPAVLLAGTPIRIPFQYAQSFILVDVKINGLVQVKLIFDTGAEHHILFDRIHTDVFAGAYAREVKVFGSDLHRELPAWITIPMKNTIPVLGEVVFPWVVLHEPEISLSEWIGQEVHGILSAQSFSQYFIEIDYKNREIILHDHLSQRKMKDFASCPVQIVRGKPYLKAISQNRPGLLPQEIDLLLDTGAGLSLMLYEGLGNTLVLPEKIIAGQLGSGLGGAISGVVGRLEKLEFCGQFIQGIPTYFQEIDSSLTGRLQVQKQGILGNQVFDRYRVVLDYRNEKLYLKPERYKNKPYRYDRSGMSVVTGGMLLSEFYVSQVAEGTPAARAGIRPGDRITRMQGKNSSALTLGRIQKILSGKEGKTIHMRLLREGHKIKVSFALKELI